MSEINDENLIVHAPSDALIRTGTASLAKRGLDDLLLAENAEQWLQKAQKFWDEQEKITDFYFERKLYDDWYKDENRRALLEKYFECLKHAVALDSKNRVAAHKLADAYLQEYGTKKNRTEALRLIQCVAEMCGAEELCEMSYAIESEIAGWSRWPDGVKQATYMWRKAAEQGNETGQFHMGELYLEGKGGLQQDYELAKYWYNKAAENGEFPPAEYFLKHFRKKRQSKPK